MSPLKNNYLTLRSKVKIPWRSLWYATHRLMVMHPHTKYHWPIWKDKKVMVRTPSIIRNFNDIFLLTGISSTILFSQQTNICLWPIFTSFITSISMVCDTPPYGDAPTYQISLTYLERQKSYGPDKLRWAKKRKKKKTD
jgi:hypothetical protein